MGPPTQQEREHDEDTVHTLRPNPSAVVSPDPDAVPPRAVQQVVGPLGFHRGGTRWQWLDPAARQCNCHARPGSKPQGSSSTGRRRRPQHIPELYLAPIQSLLPLRAGDWQPVLEKEPFHILPYLSKQVVLTCHQDLVRR